MKLLKEPLPTELYRGRKDTVHTNILLAKLFSKKKRGFYCLYNRVFVTTKIAPS